MHNKSKLEKYKPNLPDYFTTQKSEEVEIIGQEKKKNQTIICMAEITSNRYFHVFLFIAYWGLRLHKIMWDVTSYKSIVLQVVESCF